MGFFILLALFAVGLVAYLSLRLLGRAIGWVIAGTFVLSFWYPIALPVVIVGMAFYATYQEGKSVKPLFAGLALICAAIGGAAIMMNHP